MSGNSIANKRSDHTHLNFPKRKREKWSYDLLLWGGRATLWASLLFFLLIPQLKAQEFKARVTINTNRLQGVDQNLFEDLAGKLTELINDNRWTNYTFSPSERIVCEVALNLLSVENEHEYKGELFITAQRPVYNASYMTTLITFRDKDLSFQYQPFDQIQYNPNAFESNLTATIVYYIYLVLTLDNDSFAPLGGNITRNELVQIVNRAGQSFPDDKSWSSRGGTHSRYALAEALNDPAQESFRKYWYTYHREGLDLLVENIARGRTNILDKLSLLEETHKVRSMSPLLMVFSESKLKELVEIAKEASSSEKKKALDILNKLYPTEHDTLSPLRRD